MDAEPIEIVEKLEPLGSNQTGMRQRNERLVLTILRRQGPLPRAEIARKTGLSAQTVSVIMRALEAEGLLKRGEKLRGKIGQPSIPMALAPNGAYFFGLKVGRRSADLILVNFVGEEVEQISRTYSYPTPEGTLEFVRQSVADICRNLSAEQIARIAGLGIAAPYFLWEWATVIGVDPAEMAAWRDVDLRAEIAALYDFPVYSGNDATCACGAELVFGKDDAPSDFLYVYIGSFIGGGVVLNGALYQGSGANAGAIGPFPARAKDGTLRQMVDVASLIGLEQRLIRAQGDASDMWNNPELWEIERAIIDDWLDEAIPALAHMVLSAISIIDFPTVLVDGSMPQAMRDEVVARLTTELRGLDLSGLTEPKIAPGSVGRVARAIGAASLPLSKRFLLET